MQFEISRRARRQIERIQAWWTDNRPAARLLFLDELEKAEQMLRADPELGIVYTVQRSGAIRRLLLGKTEYHLYYRYTAHRNELVVVAVWGATRGYTPKL